MPAIDPLQEKSRLGIVRRCNRIICSLPVNRKIQSIGAHAWRDGLRLVILGRVAMHAAELPVNGHLCFKI